MPHLNLADFVACTESEGPGRRAALWVQGCQKRCVGCCNPGLLAIEERHIVSADQVLQWIEQAHRQFGLEGVTLLGGEPMLQARGLAAVALGCQAVGLSVMVFSGYALAELDRLRLPGVADLLASTDVLVDGPYLPDMPEGLRNWVGSRNQRFHYLSRQYAAEIETDPRWRPSVEVRLRADGSARVNGWPG